MRFRAMVALIPAVLLAGSVCLQAQPRTERGERMMETLNLTEDQVATMKEMRAEHMKAMADHEAAVKKARIDLRSLMTADVPDKSAIKGKMKDLADLRLKEEGARVDHWFAVRSMLTPEQQKLFKQTIGARMMQRGERGFDRPGRDGMMERGMHDMRERMHR